MFNHEIRTMTLSGKILYSETFKTADEAYKAYIATIDECNKTRKLVKGLKPIIVRRYNNGDLMTSHYIGLEV